MKLKKVTAALLAASMTLGLSGCTLGGNGWILKYDGGEVPAGIYVQNVFSAYNAAGYQVEDATTDVLTADIEGKTGKQWIEDTAMELTKEYLAVELKFDELGLSLTEAEKANVDTLVKSIWEPYGEQYIANGINRNSYTKAMENTFKTNELFLHYYGEGGEKAVTEQEYKDYFEQNYDRTRFIRDPKNSVDSMTEEEYAEAVANLAEGETAPLSALEQAEAALARLENGEDILTIMAEVEAEKPDELEEGHNHDDPTIHDNLVDVNDVSRPEEYRTESHAMAVGEKKIIESGNNYYVVEKLELDPTGEGLESVKDTILVTLKGDEFDALIAQWVAELPELTVNEKTVEEFSPDKLRG